MTKKLTIFKFHWFVVIVSSSEMISSSHQAISGRRASRSTRMSVSEVDSFRNQLVNIWRRNQFRRIVDRHIRPAHVVRVDDDDIRTVDIVSLIFCRSSSRRLAASVRQCPIRRLFCFGLWKVKSVIRIVVVNRTRKF